MSSQLKHIVAVALLQAAVAPMHRHDLVHGDLKPENVLLAGATPTGVSDMLYVQSRDYLTRVKQAALCITTLKAPVPLRSGGSPAVKLADLGSCFSAACVDTASLGLEMQSLPYRSPEVCCVPLFVADWSEHVNALIVDRITRQRPMLSWQT